MHNMAFYDTISVIHLKWEIIFKTGHDISLSHCPPLDASHSNNQDQGNDAQFERYLMGSNVIINLFLEMYHHFQVLV